MIGCPISTMRRLASKYVVSVMNKAWIVSYLCLKNLHRWLGTIRLPMVKCMYHKRLRMKVSSSNLIKDDYIKERLERALCSGLRKALVSRLVI
jgi:hypothetical protein